MNFTIFTFVLIIFLFLFLIFLIKYLYDIFFNKGDYFPEEWVNEQKSGIIPKELQSYQSNYADKSRFFLFWLQIRRLKVENVTGAFAELGVYKGETAKAIHLMDPLRELHLFDTFTGFVPENLMLEKGEAATYTTKNFADTSLQKVKEHIGEKKNIFYHKGNFSETSKHISNEHFALVSLDADLYQPTLEGLEFFYNRLQPGGVILIHDYNHKWEGLQKAVNEFLITIPENPVLIPDRFSTVVIVKNKTQSVK